MTITRAVRLVEKMERDLTKLVLDKHKNNGYESEGAFHRRLVLEGYLKRGKR